MVEQAAAASRHVCCEASSTFAVVTHGAGDAFWAVVKKGVLKAGKDLGVKVNYSESFNNPQKQAQLIGTAVASANSKAKIATFDLSSDVIKAIQRGQMLFAVDQQQFEQGYLPIVFLYLYRYNLNTVGGGQPVLTGPGYVEKGNASKVAAYARRGTR